MKLFLALVLIGSAFINQAEAANAPVCRDGHYMISVPAANASGVAQILAASQAAQLLQVQSTQPSRSSTIFAIALKNASALETLNVIAELPGAFVECNSEISL